MQVRWSQIEWFINCLGMSDASIWSFDADGRWVMAHGTPGATLGAFPVDGQGSASLEDVLFLANCIAFDHDLPIVVTPARDNPARKRPLVAPIMEEPGPEPGQWYWVEFAQAMGMAAEIRIGAGAVQLRYDDDHSALAQFSKRFSNALEPLGLYAMAARQVDPLGEYLGHWRVLEWGDQRNGKASVNRYLDAVPSYDFGECLVIDLGQEPVDMFETLRTRAVGRLDALRMAGKSSSAIASHLYRHRNSIAHGRTNPLLHDFGSSMEGVGADLAIVKLLARMVVERA
jgi:hypothetical protein